MFTRGEDGYHINIKQHNNQAKTAFLHAILCLPLHDQTK